MRYFYFFLFALISISAKSQILRQGECDEKYKITPLEGGAFHKVWDNNSMKYGITDSNDSLIIPINYNTINLYKYGGKFYFHLNKNFSSGLASSTGEIIIPCIYESIIEQLDANNNLKSFIVKRDGYDGVINDKGEVVIPLKCYADIRLLSEGGYIVTRGGSDGTGLKGYIDEMGNVIIPADRYTTLYKLKNGYFEATMNSRACLLDSLGRFLFSTKYTGLSPVIYKDEICLETYLGAKRGLMSMKGKEIIALEPEDYYRFYNEKNFSYYMYIDKTGLWGVKDSKKKMLIPNDYEYIFYNSEGYFKAVKQGYSAIIDTCGKVIIPIGKYNSIYGTDKEWFKVEHMSKRGVCDKTGSEIIKPIYSSVVLSGNRKYFYVRNNGFEGVLDTKGVEIIPCIYSDVSSESISFSGKEFFKVELNGKIGICDLSGKEIVPPIYDKIRGCYVNGGSRYPEYLVVKNGSKEGLIAFDGTPIFPAEYFENVSLYEDKIDAYTGDWRCTYDLDGNLLTDSKIDNRWKQYYNDGISYFDSGEFGKAADCFKNANAIKDDYSSYFNLALCYYNTYKYDNAIEYFRKSIDLNPPYTTKKRAYNLIESSYEAKREKAEKRTANITNFIAGVFKIGISLYQLKHTQKVRQSDRNNPYAGFNDYADEDDRANVAFINSKQKCGLCGGKGSIIEYTSNYGINNNPYCEECGKNVVSGHYHKVCPRCGGKGER